MTTDKLRVLSLFAGIGGFELGLERTGGFETVAQCEIDPFCRQVLAKHWPHVKRYEDVRELTADTLCRDGIAVDVICGGFPCQDISVAGRGAGLEGERSGLWFEYARLIGELRPKFVLVENVSALLGRGLDRVLGDLATLGFDAEWHCVPAGAVGAPHIRDRVWIVAYANGSDDWREQNSGAIRSCENSGQNQAEGQDGQRYWRGSGNRGETPHVAYSDTPRRSDISWGQTLSKRAWLRAIGDTSGWQPEPAVGRVVDGLSRDMARWRKRSVEALGNAVVPQIPELIGRAILETRRAA